MDIIVTFFGIFYVEILIDFIVLTMDNFQDGNKLVWLVFIISFMTDTFAYFSGYLFGKHKLIPNVSPKKTIEGSIGGILGSTICCLIFGYIFKLDIDDSDGNYRKYNCANWGFICIFNKKICRNKRLW